MAVMVVMIVVGRRRSKVLGRDILRMLSTLTSLVSNDVTRIPLRSRRKAY